MPIDPTEAIRLSRQSIELADHLRDALAPDGDGGKKITRAEGRLLLRSVLAFAAALVVDILD
jgi:hypothetical protein